MMKDSFFRQKALEHYQQNQIPRVIPKFISSLRIFSFWIFAIAIIGGVITIWSYNVPVMKQGSGIIRNVAAQALPGYGLTANGQQARAIAILLLPATFKTQIRLRDEVQIEGTQHALSGTIERLDETLLTSNDIRKRYNLSAQVVPSIQPSDFVALIGFGTTTVSPHDNEKPVMANIRVAMLDVLRLFFMARSRVSTS